MKKHNVSTSLTSFSSGKCPCVKLRNNWRPNNKIPAFYKCYVDDTLSTMPDVETAAVFLSTLHNSHPSIDFRMELEEKALLSGNGNNQEWMLAGHESV